MQAPDATASDQPGPAGEAEWADAVTHLPENLSDQPLEVVLAEGELASEPRRRDPRRHDAEVVQVQGHARRATDEPRVDHLHPHQDDGGRALGGKGQGFSIFTSRA